VGEFRWLQPQSQERSYLPNQLVARKPPAAKSVSITALIKNPGLRHQLWVKCSPATSVRAGPSRAGETTIPALVSDCRTAKWRRNDE